MAWTSSAPFPSRRHGSHTPRRLGRRVGARAPPQPQAAASAAGGDSGHRRVAALVKRWFLEEDLTMNDG